MVQVRWIENKVHKLLELQARQFLQVCLAIYAQPTDACRFPDKLSCLGFFKQLGYSLFHVCYSCSDLWILLMLTVTELHFAETCLPAHNLSISGIEHGRLTTILLTLVCLMQNKRPVLITPLSLAGDF